MSAPHGAVEEHEMKTTVKIKHNGFHGIKNATVVGSINAGGKMYVSVRVAKRLNGIVCSGCGCTCGERIAISNGYATDFKTAFYVDCSAMSNGVVEIIGRCPQR